MRVVCSRKPIPRLWRGLPGASKAVHICTIYALRGSRLGLKLLVFRTRKDLRAFWKKSIGSDLGPHCHGAVNSLGCERIKFLPHGREIRALEVDPRYYAVMGLVAGSLSLEVVVHESVHAAFAYFKRTGARNLWHEAGGLDEEGVCYPAGLLAEAVWGELRREKLV